MPRIRRLQSEGGAPPRLEDAGWIPNNRAGRAAAAAAAVLSTRAAQAAVRHDMPEMPTAAAPTIVEHAGWIAPRPKAQPAVRVRLYDQPEIHVTIAEDGAWLPRRPVAASARRARLYADEGAGLYLPPEEYGYRPGRTKPPAAPHRPGLAGEDIPTAVAIVTIEDGGWRAFRRTWAGPPLRRWYVGEEAPGAASTDPGHTYSTSASSRATSSSSTRATTSAVDGATTSGDSRATTTADTKAGTD